MCGFTRDGGTYHGDDAWAGCIRVAGEETMIDIIHSLGQQYIHGIDEGIY